MFALQLDDSTGRVVGDDRIAHSVVLPGPVRPARRPTGRRCVIRAVVRANRFIADVPCARFWSLPPQPLHITSGSLTRVGPEVVAGEDELLRSR